MISWLSLIVLFIAFAVVMIIRPLLANVTPWDISARSDAVKLLRRDKARVMRLLKDLEMERESGATAEEEYQQVRQQYLKEAAGVQRRLDALVPVEDSKPGDSDAENSKLEQSESEISAADVAVSASKPLGSADGEEGRK